MSSSKVQLDVCELLGGGGGVRAEGSRGDAKHSSHFPAPQISGRRQTRGHILSVGLNMSSRTVRRLSGG